MLFEYQSYRYSDRHVADSKTLWVYYICALYTLNLTIAFVFYGAVALYESPIHISTYISQMNKKVQTASPTSLEYGGSVSGYSVSTRAERQPCDGFWPRCDEGSWENACDRDFSDENCSRDMAKNEGPADCMGCSK